MICTCGDYGVSGDIMQTDRRHNARQATDLMGLMSSMWDGKFACLGVVEDVSARGIRISQVPSHFDVHAHQCVSIVHGPCHDLHITLRPCWRSETKKAMYQLIGFRIVTPTVHWAKFIAETFVSQAQKRPQGRGE